MGLGVAGAGQQALLSELVSHMLLVEVRALTCMTMHPVWECPPVHRPAPVQAVASSRSACSSAISLAPATTTTTGHPSGRHEALK